MKKPRSYLVTGLLAGATLYFAQGLSRAGRTWIDWTVLGLIGFGILWNVFRLGRRLYRCGRVRWVWHLLRTLFFWLAGIAGTPWAGARDSSGWENALGWALLIIAALDSIALYRKERSAMARERGQAAVQAV